MSLRSPLSLLALAGAALALARCGGPRTGIPSAAKLAPSRGADSAAGRSAAPGPRTAPEPSAPPATSARPAEVAPTPAASSTVASAKIDASWAPCHRSFRATTRDVSKDVAARAGACAKLTKMTLLDKTLTGQQAAQDQPQSFALEAKAHHCYRVYAEGSEGIKNLDLAVKDSAGIVVGEDSTADSRPVVLEDGAVCFSKDDKATVVVSVGFGIGSYAVQIWVD